MDNHEPTGHDIDSFRRLLMHLPMEADQELIILKGHLLIEEQLRAIIIERMPEPSSLELSNINWQFYHIARLAEALCFGEEEDVVWRCIQKLNKIRNDLAHNLDPQGLSDRVDDLIQTWPSGFEDGGKNNQLYMTLAVMFTVVSALVKKPSNRVINLVKQ